jgi:Scaffold protein Nfu/NifU N terminal
MGQTMTVTVTNGARREVRHFATNRSITGMSIERFASAEAAAPGLKPPHILARRLFELGGVNSVSLYSNTLTVEADPSAWNALEPQVISVIEHFFHFYGEGAGYSVAALAPYGIDRKPSPVQ